MKPHPLHVLALTAGAAFIALGLWQMATAPGEARDGAEPAEASAGE